MENTFIRLLLLVNFVIFLIFYCCLIVIGFILDKAIRSIDIYLPLNSFLYIEEDFIYHIGKQANTEKLINIYFSGIEPITIKQRSTIEKITKLTNT